MVCKAAKSGGLVLLAPGWGSFHTTSAFLTSPHPSSQRHSITSSYTHLLQEEMGLEPIILSEQLALALRQGSGALVSWQKTGPFPSGYEM